MKKTSILISALFSSFLLASCGGGSSGGSAATPNTPVPTAPSNLTATESSGTVNLSWGSVAGATYKVYQSTASIANNLLGHISYDVTETSTEITGLTNGRSYYFVVTALANGKESIASDEIIGIPDFPIPLVPTSLTVTNASGTVNLSWTGSDGATYKVYKATGSIGADLSSYTSYNVTITSKEITGLINGANYYFVVTALVGDKESGASNEVIGLPDFPIPSTPTNLRATPSSGTVNLSWDSVAGASYKVYQSTGSIGNDLSSYTSYNVSTTSTEITELTNGTRYYFVLTVLVNGKESLASDEVDGLPDFPIPSTPTNLTVTSVSSGTVNLSWDSVAGATYKVYQSTTSIANNLLGHISYDVTETSTKITGLTNNTSYYFVVTALANGKESLASDEVDGFPEFPVPSTPTSLTVTSESSGRVILSWTGSDGATYKVHQAKNSFDGVDDYEALEDYTSRNVSTSSIEISDLTNGETYYFVVTALANGKESPASEWVSALPDFPIPSAPTSLTVTSASSGTVNLSWNSVAGASYTVYRSIGPIANDLSTSQPYETTRNSIAITGLINNTRYYFVVTALANGKESPASNEVSGLPEFPVPSTPTNLTANASSGTVNLSWTGSEGVHYYKVYQSTATIIADDLSSYSSYNVRESSRAILGLTNNTTYYFVVTAVIGDKESGASDEISGLPEFPQPSTPTNLRATPSSGTVNLSWTGSVGAHYYKVYQSTGTIIADDLSSYTSYNVRANTIEIPRLANGTTYYFVVRAVIGDKESAISDEVSGLPEENLIAPPTNLMVTASSGTVSLNWTGREGATYTVHQADQTFGVADYTTLEGYTSTHVTETSKEITGLTNGASYYFVVTALVGSKESGASNEVIGNPDFPIPSTPTNLIVSSASSGTVNLSWNSVAGASYNVYQATVQIDDDDLSSYTSYNVTTNSKEISGLTNGTRYYFVVTALENGKESPASNEVRVLPDSPIPETPTGLVVTSTSSGAVNLRWNSVAGATYKVYRSTATIGDDLSASIFHNATTSSIEITGLRNGTRYYFVVRALVNGKESLASNEVSGLPDFPIPAPPTGLEVTSVSSGTVNLRWNSVAGVSYKVYQSTVTSFSDDLSSYTSYNVRARSIGIPELINGVTYYFVVTALANGKESPVSDEVSGLPDFPIPLTPIDLEVTSVSSGTVNLSWNSVAGASYKVYQSTGSIGGDLSSYTSYNVRARSIGIPELINGVTYYFVVTALANGKESPASDEVSGLPDFPIPAPPTGLVVTNASSGTVNLSWNSVAGVSYKVYQSTGSIGDDLSSYSSYNVSTSLIEITGLTNGSTYYFVVTALANGKESLASDEVSGFPEFPQPSTPTNLRATPSSGKVNLSWIGSTGANYRVYQSTATPFSDDLSSYSSYNVRASSIEIPGLTNGTTYYFVVRAMIGDKKSGVSEEISGLPEENLLAPPTNLEVTASSGTVNLNWTGREGATYKVHQATSSFGDDVSDYATLTGYISYDVTETSTKITELTNGVTYYFVVTALVGDKESGASNEVIGLPDFPIPSTPTSLTVTSASSGTVNLSWNSVAGATSYKVYQSSELIGDDLAGYTSLHVTTTSAEITDLTNGSSYYFVVTAFANGKESPASNEISGLPDFPIPATPTGFVVTGVSSGTVNLSWDSVAGATYKVYQSTATIGDDLSSYTSYNVTTTSTEITGLTNGSSYYFVVTALANGKESLASDEVDGLPDFPIPATPTGFVVTGVSSGTVNLSWDSVAGATYKVYQSTATIGDDLSSYTSYNVTTTSTEITGLTNGSSYYFVVTALANGKESLASDEVDGLPDFPIPLVPTSLTVTNASSGTVNLSWNSVAGASYKVYQSTRSIGDDLSSYTSYNVTTTSTAITELTNGTSYYFVVTALANGKESPASDEVDGLPDFPIPATPTSLVASASSGTVNLSWNSVAGASYRVYQSTATIMVDDLSSYTTYNVSTSSTEIPELTNGTRYYFVVTALANGKESPASDEVNGLPDFPIPLVPTSLTVTSISSGTVNLSWNSVAGASYRVYQSTATIIVDDLSSYTSYNVSTSSTEIPELTNGTRYYFVVTALANGKESGVSSEVDALPDFPIPATPTGLVVVSVSSGTVNLSWNSVAGATYKVYQSTATIGDDLSSYTYYNVMTTSKEITELTNGTSYYFVVTALANGKESPASNEVDGLPDFPIPATPTSLTVTNESSGTVNLSWNSVAGATYKVYQSTATIGDDLSSYTSYNATTISKVITDLTNGSRYYFVVTALANGKESPASDEVNGLPDFPIPEAPTSLTVTNESSGTVNLSWDSVAGATYKVYQSTRSIGDDLSSYTSYNATTISKVITDLTNGTRYYFVVTALANGKESPASDEVNGLPDFPIPEAPTSLTVTNESSGTVNLSWNSVAGASYKVYQSTATIGDDLSSYTSYNATTISKVITDLTNGTRYYFVVTALANGKESPASEWASGLPDFPIPEAPTSLTVTNESSGTVNLSWNSVAGATYRVYQSTATIGDDLSSYTFYSVSTIPIEIIGLTNGTSYYFVVTALANGKESPASNEAIGLPDFPIPATPTGLVVASVSSGTVNLSWNSVAGATYKVYQSSATIGDDLSSYTSYNAAATSKEITGLTNGTSYYFVVTALANGKESSASDEVNALPDFPIPATPTNLRATPSSGTVNLSWNSVAGATYKVYQSSATIGDDLSSYTSYNVSTIPIEIIGLTNGTSYYFVVTALANGKESPASNEAIGLPDFPIPATPTNLIASASSGTVNLSWTGSDGAHNYKVYQSTGTIISDDLLSYQSYNITETSTKITGLTNNTSYYFVVTALANGKESPASNEAIGLPEFPVPSMPTTLTVTSESSGTVNLSWTGSDGAHYYKVYQSTGTIISDDLSSHQPYIIAETSTNITGLVNGTSYYFVVTAVIGDKESGVSNEAIGLPDFSIPATPTGLMAISSSGTVNLSWNSVDVAGASYKVYQSTATIIAADLSSYSSYNVSLSSTAITGLTNGTSYYFVVTALANGKESPASNEAIGLPDFPIPATPTNLIASASSGTVNLSWTGSDGAHNYKVYQSTGTIISDDLLSYQSYNIAETSTKITGLTNNTSYYFVVTALANGKESPASNEAIGLPEFPVPSMPTTLTVTSESSGTVNLSWTGSDGAHYYKVYQSTGTIISDDLSSYQPYIIAETSTNITGLVNGTSYYFVVTAVIGDKESGVSNEAIGLPDFSIPATPTGLMAISSSGTVNLSWNSVDVAGASYKVYQSTATIIAADLSSYTSYNVSLSSTAITGLMNGTSYYFVVTALANGKESPASNEVDGLPDFPIPATPTNLIASASSGTVNLSWTGSDGAHNYKVYQSTGTIISDDLLSYQSYNIAETSTKITGLTNNTSYYFVVTALANGKESPASNEAIGLPEFPVPSMPTTLTVTSESSGTVNLSWTGSDGAYYYKVYQSTGTIISDDLSSYQPYIIAETSTNITGLVNGTSYYFVVTAVIGDKESGVSNEAIGLPDFSIPATPTGLMAISSSGTVNLSWTGSDGAHNYKVYQSTGTIIAADLSSYSSYNVSLSSTAITGLTNNTSYYFVVTALANGKESPASNEAIGLPEFPVPSMPTTLTVTSESSGTVNLSWNSVDGASYKVYQSTGTIIADDLSSYSSYKVSLSSTAITGLTNGTLYYFVVTALANGKESPASNEVDGLPDFPIPLVPTSLTVTSESSGTVNLSWDSVDGVSYKVYQSTATIIADDLSSYSSYNVSVSSTAITGLTNGTLYYFVVTALANGKESPASNEVSGFPDFPIPATPTSLVASASSGTVNLSWNSVAGATYKVYQSTATIDDDLSSYSSYNVTVTSKEITGLTNRTTYYFVVTALANGKESLASDEVSGFPEFPIPSTPTSLTVTNASSGTVNLSWTGRDRATYKVHQAKNSFVGSAVADYETLMDYKFTHVTTTSTEITGLTNGTTYYFVVTAVIADKESGASDEVEGLPDFPIPPPPTSLMVTSASSGTVSLSWNSVAGATYKVHQATQTFNNVLDYEILAGYTSAHSTAISKEITGLTNGETYYFVVTALANGKESPASNEIIGLPDFPIPPPPTALTVTSVSYRIVQLSWAGSDGAAYRLHLSTETFNNVLDYGTLSDYQSTVVNTTEVEIIGLTNGISYYFVITALANGKESLASNEVSGMPFFHALNDTGITWAGHSIFGNTTGTNCTPTGFATTGHSRQDCHQGRDAEAVAGTLLKKGGGNAGFDFTKLGSTGTVLSIQDVAWSDNGSESLGTKWSCVHDNVTGLTWEVKTDLTPYKWGGLTALGGEDENSEGTYDEAWNGLVTGTNDKELCGYNDWRVPTITELVSIVDLGVVDSDGNQPAIDTNYFRNDYDGIDDYYGYWSSSPRSDDSTQARLIYFDGRVATIGRDRPNLVRLVRSSQ